MKSRFYVFVVAICLCSSPAEPGEVGNNDSGEDHHVVHQFRNNLSFLPLIPWMERNGTTPRVFIISPTDRGANAIRLLKDGSIKGIFLSPLSTKTSRSNAISNDQAKRVWASLADLPPTKNDVANSALPHSLIVRWFDGAQWSTRLYDRGDLPQPVKQILRHLPYTPAIGSKVSHFTSTSTKVADHDISAYLVASPIDPILIWVRKTSQLILIKYDDSNKIHTERVSWNEEDVIDTATFHPSKHLLLLTSHKRTSTVTHCQLTLLDTKSWQLVKRVDLPHHDIKRVWFYDDHLVLLLSKRNVIFEWNIRGEKVIEPTTSPAHARQLWLSQNTANMLLWDGDESVSLWNCKEKRRLVEICQHSSKVEAGFSNDGKFVAVNTSTKSAGSESDKPLFSVYDARSGEIKKSLLAYDVSNRYYKELKWLGNDNYIVATVDRKLSKLFAAPIHVWDTQSGNHVADLFGPSTHPSSSRVHPTIQASHCGNKLFAASPDGTLHFWDIDAISRTLNTLRSTSTPSTRK